VTGRVNFLNSAAANIYDRDRKVLVIMKDKNNLFTIRRPIRVAHRTIASYDFLLTTAVDVYRVDSSM